MNLMRRTSLALGIVAMSAGLAHAQQGVSKGEIVVGTIQDLSGPIAAFGKQARNGMQLRVEEINEQGGINGRKIKLIVEEAGGQFRDIVKITRYFKDIADQDKVNQVIFEYFGDHLPCSTTVQVVGFVVPTMKLELDCWAVIGAGKSKGR